MMIKQKTADLTDKRFGKLLVIKREDDALSANGKRFAMWECICDCGNVAHVKGIYLRSGDTKSCGCSKRKKQPVHGLCRHPLYGIYHSMISRCSNRNNSRYKTYGARGISVCDEWLGKNGFMNFYAWSISNGWSKDKNGRTEQSLDRIDNNGMYSPNNCKFSTSYEQAQHTTRSHYESYKGRKMTVSQWDKECGFPKGTVSQRLRVCGMNIGEALTKPLRIADNGVFRYQESRVK